MNSYYAQRSRISRYDCVQNSIARLSETRARGTSFFNGSGFFYELVS